MGYVLSDAAYVLFRVAVKDKLAFAVLDFIRVSRLKYSLGVVGGHREPKNLPRSPPAGDYLLPRLGVYPAVLRE